MTYTFKLARRLAVSRHFLVLTALVVLVACSGDTTAPDAGPSSSYQTFPLQIIPRAVTVEVNQPVRFQGRALQVYSNLLADPSIIWTSSGGSIRLDGTFQSAVPGSFKVTGRGRHWKSDTSVVTVVTSPTNLVRVAVTPGSKTLLVGATQSFTATGFLQDGSTTSVGVVWSATGGTVDPSGLYTAGPTAGSYRVVASSASSTLADTASVTINEPAPALSSVVISPASVSLAMGASKQFAAYGRTSAGDSVPVTASFGATGGTITSSGLYTAGLSAGTYRVIATSSGLADTAVVSITATSSVSTSDRHLAGGFWNYPATYCNSSGVTGSSLTTSTGALLSSLQTARKCNVRLVIVPGRKFITVDGTVGSPLSLDSAKAFTDRLARVLVPDTLRKYDPWIIGFNLADDYQCTKCWGGVAVTQSQIAAWASYVRQKIPALRIGVRADPAWVQGSTLPGLIDYAWAQYHTGKGDARTYFDKHASLAKSLGIALAMGVNVTHCGGPNTAPCTPTQIREFMGMAAQYPDNCALLGWTYDSATLAQTGMSDAWDYVLNLAAQHRDVLCKHL